MNKKASELLKLESQGTDIRPEDRQLSYSSHHSNLAEIVLLKKEKRKVNKKEQREIDPSHPN